MTDSGTQQDPYIPTTWTEFVTTVGTANTTKIYSESIDDPHGIFVANVKKNHVLKGGLIFKKVYVGDILLNDDDITNS